MKITCAPGVKESASEVRQSALFKRWARRARGSAESVVVNAVYAWGGEIRMIQMAAQHEGRRNAVFLRGPSVDMLTVVTDGKVRYIVHVEQFRVAVGQMVRSNPAGMVDTGESPVSAAMRELAEEVGSHITWQRAKSMHSVLGSRAALLGSPGASDEDIKFFVVEGRLSSRKLRQLSRHIGGLAHEGERLALRLTPFDGFDVDSAVQELCKGAGRHDLKAVTSLYMYARYIARKR